MANNNKISGLKTKKCFLFILGFAFLFHVKLSYTHTTYTFRNEMKHTIIASFKYNYS